MKYRIFTSLLFWFAVFQLSAQNIESWIAANEKLPSEKIYIQTDCENYFHNDTIRMKFYLTDSRSGQLIPSAENVYIRLLDKTGVPVLQSILLAVNGEASGQIAIPDTLKPGNYLMQAYTNYLLNFDNNAHFYKTLSVSRISSYSSATTSKSREENMVADVTFLPEGGVLLENVTNVVAFRAVSREGFGVNASGTVKDERENTVTTFSTDYKGMGVLFLTPEKGKTYTARVTGFPSFRYRFEPVKEGVKIQLVNHTSREVIVNVAGNSPGFSGKTFYIANMHRGRVLFYQEFRLDGMTRVLKFDNNSLNDGINRLVLLDENLVPVSERLVFENPRNLNKINVTSGVETYSPREQISITLAGESAAEGSEVSNLSVSVVHEAAVPPDGSTKNIVSHLLIDSELNGFVESSADLFTDNELSSDAKLRLVMLTNGWSSYFWNGAPAAGDSVRFMQKGGLSLKGIAKNPLTGAPVKNGEITVVIQKDTEMGFITKITDEEGSFNVPGLLFSDTALVYVQAKTEAGNMNTDIVLEPVFKDSPAGEKYLRALDDNVYISDELTKLKYFGYSELNRYLRAQNRAVRRISETDTQSREKHFKLYENADFVLEVDENEKSFENVIDYMVGKVPGLDIHGTDIKIRGASSFTASSIPLFLVDGIPVVAGQEISLPEEVAGSSADETSRSNDLIIRSVKTIPINDVEKIEILKSPTNLAVFGAKGANGVIAIYTRHGEKTTEDANTRGIIEKKIVGYSGFRNFYSPKYTPENRESDKPDFRTTLYWNPSVKTSGGTVEIPFFSSDETGQYRIFVEGITCDGKICLGTGEFVVENL